MSEPTPYRTKTGRILSSEELAALADEAERGYDVSKLKRRPGRPLLGSAPAAVVPVRLYPGLHEAAKLRAASDQTSMSDLVRQALAAYLANEPTSLGVVQTASGRVLSSSDLDAWASEADAGYDPKVLKPKPARRRPRAETVAIRLTPELESAVDRRAELEATSVSDVIRIALAAYLEDPEPDPPSAWSAG